MGAEGNIIVVERARWDEACDHMPPEDIGLYTGTILGVEAAWGYCGDNLLDGTNFGDDFTLNYDEHAPESKAGPSVVQARKKALEWFNSNAEWHEVWT